MIARQILFLIILALQIKISAGQDEGLPSVGMSDANPGEFYLAETYRDWKRLCVRTENESELCHIYQLIVDENNHATGEINLFRLNEEEGVSAVGTILTPLGTLLTSNLLLSIDERNSAEYPFSWCDSRGCYVNLGLTDDDVFSMRKGKKAIITIKSVSLPDRPIELEISLYGFTDAFASLE